MTKASGKNEQFLMTKKIDLTQFGCLFTEYILSFLALEDVLDLHLFVLWMRSYRTQQKTMYIGEANLKNIDTLKRMQELRLPLSVVTFFVVICRITKPLNDGEFAFGFFDTGLEFSPTHLLLMPTVCRFGGHNVSFGRWLWRQVGYTIDDAIKPRWSKNLTGSFTNKTPLMDLCHNRYFPAARWLTQEFKLASDLFRAACWVGHLETVQWVTKQFNLTVDDAHRARVLSVACGHKQVEVAQWLIKKFRFTIQELHNSKMYFETNCELDPFEALDIEDWSQQLLWM